MMTTDIESHVKDLLTQIGKSPDAKLTPLKGGGNNRGYRVESDGFDGFLKAYFRFPGDPRNRLKTESSFVQFARQKGIQQVPDYYGRIDEKDLGLYEFIPGTPLKPGEVDSSGVQEAQSFFLKLNEVRQSNEANELTKAAEACFSTADHIQIVERRLARLKQVEGKEGVYKDAVDLIQKDLTDSWRQVLAQVKKQTASWKGGIGQPIPREDWCLSPSDFGFHNALRQNKEPLRFVDFEYAGWDDPVKMICDFFNHPKVPVPHSEMDSFVKNTLTVTSSVEMHTDRVHVLMPVCRIKWCCIMLNDFLPMGKDRMKFLEQSERSEEHLRNQLTKVKESLRR